MSIEHVVVTSLRVAIALKLGIANIPVGYVRETYLSKMVPLHTACRPNRFIALWPANK